MKTKINVYEIGALTIAADSVDSALGLFVEETNGLDNYFIDEPEVGEVVTLEISIRKLPEKALQPKNLPCCYHGCSKCDNLDDHLYVSLQDVLDASSSFPCVLAREE